MSNKRIGVIAGDLQLYYKGVRDDYPSYTYDSPILQVLADDGYEIVVLVDSEAAKVKAEKKGVIELDTFGVPYTFGLMDDVDLLFLSILLVSKSQADLTDRLLTKIQEAAARGVGILYRDSDEETWNAVKGTTADTRDSMVHKMRESGVKFSTLIVSQRCVELGTEDHPIIYVPAVYCERHAARVRASLPDQGYDDQQHYLNSFAGAMTGRNYYPKLVEKLLAQFPELPSNAGCYMGRLGGLDIAGVITEIRAGLTHPGKYFGPINQSKFHLHGASWYAPRLRKNVDPLKSPPYGVLKLMEGMYTNNKPFVITLDVPELDVCNFPREHGVATWPALEFTVPSDPVEFEEVRQTQYKALEMFEVGNWLKPIYASAELAGY
jgi:hypothetical protein